ncbi:GNAT family N-acetyltransferase [Vulgatibacter incomptus]|uniref:Cellulose biosynthesis protein n=1 Tax=Vulgatibacter incomptus TaxID=1391653 RepID=A0A0K1PAY0_9BACT|nr:GNAT family N-acetyltransferase [Vulgatibacter incomptus]AKU90662.1 cellulose biosynthesis protein [Vulgatibacter incomptus]
MSRLWVEERAGPGAQGALELEWKQIFSKSDAAPFLSWEWADAWLRHLGPGRKPRIFCVRDEFHLVGLLALCEESRKVPGLRSRIRRLSFAGERLGGADYLDVLALPGRHAEVTRAILERLATEPSFDLLELDGIASDSPTLPLAREAFGSNEAFSLRTFDRWNCPRIGLDGGFATVLAQSGRGDNYRRRLRQLKALKGFEHRAVTGTKDAKPAFERFLELHERRWADQGGSDAMGRPSVRAFHRETVERLAGAGLLRFDELWAEGGCRSSIYGIDTKGVFYFYQTGYDPEWARRSVGLAILGLSIEAAAGRGARVYDFLHGEEAYKREWARDIRKTVSLRVAAKGLGAAFLLSREAAESAARAAARSVLPDFAVEGLRRWRRAREHAES